jgi:DeoR/GlpR family transcriptional regulator of sugar metabolism
MESADRQNYILDQLSINESMSISSLLNMLPASPATIRRDLTVLEQAGRIRKARGKIFKEDSSKTPAFDLREIMHDEEKNSIGRTAAALVREGDSIIIDAGTTTLAFANCLRQMNKLSVITNSIPVLYTFNNTRVATFVCGGMLEDMALIDDDAVNFFATRRVDKAFIAASGVRGEDGLTVVSPFQFSVKRKMIQSASEVYALIDSSKFNIMGINLFVDFSEITGIVTSKPIRNQALLERLDKLNVKIIYSE